MKSLEQGSAATDALGQTWDLTVDWLVAGSGAGGMAAALFAAKQGMQVLLCEKTSQLGGTTATSGGVVWIPNNDQARDRKLGDSPEKARRYLKQELGSYYTDELIDAYLENGNAALRFLEENTDVKFNLIPWPDYHPAQPDGMKMGRSLVTSPFDGRLLKSKFKLVRPPLHRLMILGGLMVQADEISAFLNPFRSFAAMKLVSRKVGRFAIDRLRYPRGTDVRYGNALISRFFYSLQKTTAQIYLNCPLTKILDIDGRVVGAVVKKDSKLVKVRARKGVVLATGGFPHDLEMRKKYFSNFPHDHSAAFTGNVGEGIRVASECGAAIDTAMRSPALWSPASSLKDKNGAVSTVMYGYLDRGRPGVIAVDPDGQRFVNESNSYHDIVMAIFNQQRGKDGYYFICDTKFIRKYGMGLIRPHPITLNVKPFVESGYIIEGDTIGQLAKAIGLKPEKLAASVERHNEFARTGVDLDFHRGGNAYNWQYADATDRPNANLVPIDDGPFYALKIEPATLGTTVGLKADGKSRVLNTQGEVIPGLYACGNERASVFRGFYPGGGSTLGPAITFAYAAVQDALAQTPSGLLQSIPDKHLARA